LPTIKVFEHSFLELGKTYSNVKFEEHHLRTLQSYNDRNKNKYFTNCYKKVKFSNYVGVIQIGNLTIEVLPKADNTEDDDNHSKDVWHRALIDMLRYTGNLRLEYLTNANLNLLHHSLFNIFIETFLFEVESLLNMGLVKRYTSKEENTPYLKGKLLLSKHLKYNSVNKQKFYTKYVLYNYNNVYNQIVVKALNVLSNFAKGNIFYEEIQNLIIQIPEVDDVVVSDSTFLKLKFDRKTQCYSHAITLAKMILLNYNPDIRHGNDNVLSILFDMNKLYEQFIYNRLRVTQDENFVVCRQSKVFWIPENNRAKTVKADIFIRMKDQNLVVDTKWKILNNIYPSDEDLKQMFVYNHYYSSVKSILLYPMVNSISSVKGLFTGNRIKFNEGFQDHSCQTLFTPVLNEVYHLDKDIGIKIKQQIMAAFNKESN